MQEIKLKLREVKPIIKRLFPDYNGRKLYLEIKEYYNYSSTSSYWSGGYKSVVRILTQDNGNTSVSSPNELANPIIMKHGTQKINLDQNIMVVVLQYAGREKWVNFYVGPNSNWMPKLLKEKN